MRAVITALVELKRHQWISVFSRSSVCLLFKLKLEPEPAAKRSIGWLAANQRQLPASTADRWDKLSNIWLSGDQFLSDFKLSAGSSSGVFPLI